MIAATSSHQKLPVSAKTAPPKIISPAPSISILPRPTRSATLEMYSEMIASPARVSESSKPICTSLKPNADRYSASTTLMPPKANIRTARVANSNRPSRSSKRSALESNQFTASSGQRSLFGFELFHTAQGF